MKSITFYYSDDSSTKFSDHMHEELEAGIQATEQSRCGTHKMKSIMFYYSDDSSDDMHEELEVIQVTKATEQSRCDTYKITIVSLCR